MTQNYDTCCHYIRTDANNNIVYGFSDVFDHPQSGDICINENGGRHFELNGVINPFLATYDGIFKYKWNENTVIEKTETEIEAERVELPYPVDTLDVLAKENTLLKAQVQALSDRGEFIEECIAEMAMLIYA